MQDEITEEVGREHVSPETKFLKIDGQLYRTDEADVLAADPDCTCIFHRSLLDPEFDFTEYLPAAYLMRSRTGAYFVHHVYSDEAKMYDHHPQMDSIRALTLDDAIPMFGNLPKQYCSFDAAFPKTSSHNDVEELLVEIDSEAEMMRDVATGGSRIQVVSDEYLQRRRRIRQLLNDIGIPDPNPHTSLWDWYGKWQADLPSYHSRRDYIESLFGPLREALISPKSVQNGTLLSRSIEPTGWIAVDHEIAELNQRLTTAMTIRDYQAIGVRCRDLMITLAEACHNPLVHGEVGASAVEKLNAVVNHHAAGGSHESLRRLLKATIDFANTVQHRRAATLQEARILAEATVSAVTLIRLVTTTQR